MKKITAVLLAVLCVVSLTACNRIGNDNGDHRIWEDSVKTYTDAAELNIIPAPDSLLRAFMTWKPLDEAVEIGQQEFTEFERRGFTAVEWGGAKIS